MTWCWQPLRALAVLVLAWPSLVDAAPSLSLGPYRVGMSNSEASRLGMSQCKEITWLVECRASIQVLGQARDVHLKFDASRKRLVEASLVVSGPSWSEAMARQILSELGASQCERGLEETSIFAVECYRRPDQVRRIVWHTNRYWVSVRGRDGQALAWFKKTQASATRERRESAFEQGK